MSLLPLRRRILRSWFSSQNKARPRVYFALSSDISSTLDAFGLPCFVMGDPVMMVHANMEARAVFDSLSCQGATLVSAAHESSGGEGFRRLRSGEVRTLVRACDELFELRVKPMVLGPEPDVLALVTVQPDPHTVRPEALAQAGMSRRLTSRQTDVAVLMGQRLSHREIAEKLGISPHTVRRHEEAVLTKLTVRRRSQVLAALMCQDGLAPAG